MAPIVDARPLSGTGTVSPPIWCFHGCTFMWAFVAVTADHSADFAIAAMVVEGWLPSCSVARQGPVTYQWRWWWRSRAAASLKSGDPVAIGRSKPGCCRGQECWSIEVSRSATVWEWARCCPEAVLAPPESGFTSWFMSARAWQQESRAPTLDLVASASCPVSFASGWRDSQRRLRFHCPGDVPASHRRCQRLGEKRRAVRLIARSRDPRIGIVRKILDSRDGCLAVYPPPGF